MPTEFRELSECGEEEAEGGPTDNNWLVAIPKAMVAKVYVRGCQEPYQNVAYLIHVILPESL